MKKILLVIFSLMLGLTLVGCNNNQQQQADTTSLSTEVAKNWLNLGANDLVSAKYTRKVYEPESKKDAYFTIYAPTDIKESIRVVSNKLDPKFFEAGATSKVRYLATTVISDSAKEVISSKAVAFEETIKSEITDFTAKVQPGYETTFQELGMESYNEDENYLCVFYMPMLLRSYKGTAEEGKDGEITLTTFVIVPVYTTTSGFANAVYTKELVANYVANNKLVTFTYEDGKIK